MLRVALVWLSVTLPASAGSVALTVTLSSAVLLLWVLTVMVVEPTFRPVTRPSLDTLAIFLSALL